MCFAYECDFTVCVSCSPAIITAITAFHKAYISSPRFRTSSMSNGSLLLSGLSVRGFIQSAGRKTFLWAAPSAHNDPQKP